MARPNFRRPDFDESREHPGFRSRRARLGRQAGTEKLGLSLFELPAGEAAYPYHWHMAEEEILVVLEGHPSVRTPHGWRVLDEGEVLAFPVGEQGAHQVVNRTDRTVRFLAFSNQQPDIMVFPESGKIAAFERIPEGGGRAHVFREADAIGYWDDEQPPAATANEAPASAILPALPPSFGEVDLIAAGFEGWQTWDQLRKANFEMVPDGPSAYVIFRPTKREPVFLEQNPGGNPEVHNPTDTIAKLETKWVPEAHVIYIGKANAAKRRLRQFARFGAGESANHWGGRYIWQLADSAETLVAWHPITWDEDARVYEQRLITHFGCLHGKLPFANLSR